MNLALGMGLNKMRHGALVNQNEPEGYEVLKDVNDEVIKDSASEIIYVLIEEE